MVLLNQSDTFDVADEVTVHRLGFGAMRLTGPNVIGPPDDEAAAREVLERAVELGVDFVDTADSYGPGVSERIVGEVIGGDDDVLVASKAGKLRSPDGDWINHGDPDYITNQALCTRDRLRTDTIDLYQFHGPDPDTPYEDSIHAFAELKDRGIIEHVGISNVTVDQLETARDVVEIATVQNRYNVTDRAHEDVLAACEGYDIGFIPWYPLAAGDLDDKADVLGNVADAHDATPYQVALAWLLQHSPVTLPIPGTSSVDHLEANVAASATTLDDEEMKRLDD